MLPTAKEKYPGEKLGLSSIARFEARIAVSGSPACAAVRART
jgi:hypothetical protein